MGDAMSVLRKDPSTGRWVVFEREPRDPEANGDQCPFCGGHEAMTPPEIAAWGPPGRRANQPGWQVRVVPNARPSLRIEEPLRRAAEGMYDAASGTGAHEIVIETPEHRASLTELPSEHVALVLEAWAERIKDLKRDTRIRSVFVFKNQGRMAGAILPGHTHSQVIGLPITPKALKEMLAGARAHYKLKERCVYCDMIHEELDLGRRLVASSDHFVAIAPFASRRPYECWILPREHGADFEASDKRAFPDLAALLKTVLSRLEALLPEPAYNLFVYSGPSRDQRPGYWTSLEDDFHWHIAILPRPTQVAGFEVGTGFYANSVMPEAAAAALRDPAG
jgi:UDPglucose--hexose-1-phosphate uridylyltransferase